MLLVPETFWKRGLVFLVSNQRGRWAALSLSRPAAIRDQCGPPRNSLGLAP